MQPPPADDRNMELDGARTSFGKTAKNVWLRRRWLRYASAACVQALALAGGEKLPAAGPTSRWPYEVTAGLFRIHADFEISPQGELLSEMQRLSGDVAKLLEMKLPKTMMHVVIFSSRDEYQRYMAHYYPALPERRALFIQQHGTGMLFAHRHADLATDLRHETVHAILNDDSGPLPLWLDEGLAEYFEVPAAERWSGHTHLLALKNALAEKEPWPQLEALEAIGDVSGMSGDHYRDAWSWVHFLLHRRQSTRRILVEHLHDLRAARRVPALSRAIASQIPDWRNEFSDHFKRLA